MFFFVVLQLKGREKGGLFMVPVYFDRSVILDYKFMGIRSKNCFVLANLN